VCEFVDHIAGERYLYRYDLAGRVESVCCYYLNGNSIVLTDKIAQTFDANNRLTSVQDEIIEGIYETILLYYSSLLSGL